MSGSEETKFVDIEIENAKFDWSGLGQFLQLQSKESQMQLKQ